MESDIVSHFLLLLNVDIYVMTGFGTLNMFCVFKSNEELCGTIRVSFLQVLKLVLHLILCLLDRASSR